MKIYDLDNGPASDGPANDETPFSCDHTSLCL
jgi:hypothetical protein